MTPSWYDVLDIEPTATADEIRAAWRSGIADLEPGSRRFQTLNQAAEVLLDEQKRAAYDAELAAQAPEPVIEDEPQAGVDLTSSTDVSPAPVSTDSARARTVPSWALALLAVLLVATLGATVWAWQRDTGGPVRETIDRVVPGDLDGSVEAAGNAAHSAAVQAIVPVLSYDYESLEADQKRAQAYLTARYREKYDELFGVIEDNAPSTQTKVAAEVIASAIVRSGEDRVDVLVFVDRPTTNKLTSEPVTYKDQVTVTMQKVGDDWLIDNMVTSPAAQ